MQKILNFFLENTRVTALLLFAVLISGVGALLGIEIESAPELNQPIGIVQTLYPNSSASDVEATVTKILEEEINGLPDLLEYSSTSMNNLSSIVVRFESKADPKSSLDKLRTAMSDAASRLPSEAELPKVIELDFNNQSIITLSVVGDLPKLELSQIADDVASLVGKIPGVSKTEISGEEKEIIQIILDSTKLESFGLSLNEVVNAINSSNINAPLGKIERFQQEIDLRLVGEATELEQLRNLPIRGMMVDGVAGFTTLQDVGEVNLGVEVGKTDSFVSLEDGRLESSVSIGVYKSSGGNIVNIVKNIREEIVKIQEKLGGNIEIVVTNDNASFIREDLSTLGGSGLETMVIIFVSLIFFLTIREALVAAIAVPVIFLMTFAVLFFMGETLNSLTIFSLILSLGLIVDTSIVIVEGIHHHRLLGYSKLDSAKKSLEAYIWPLISGNLTTVAAFAPMLLIDGLVGSYIRTIPIVLSITLFCSLFVSFVFTPFISGFLLEKEVSKNKKTEMMDSLRDRYERFLLKILDSNTAKIGIVITVFVLFALALSMPFTGLVKTQFFPSTDTQFIYVNVEAPTGYSIKETRKLAEPIADFLREDPNVENFVFNIGTHVSFRDMGATSVKSNYGHFIVNLNENKSSRIKSYILAQNFRDEFAEIPNLKVEIEEVSAGPPTSLAVDVKIVGPELDELKVLAEKLKSKLGSINGIINLATDFDSLSDELNLVLDQEILSYYGISNQQLSLILMAYSNGLSNKKLEISGKDFDSKIYLEDTDIKSLEDLQGLLIPTTKGYIPLNYLGDFSSNEAMQFIPRIDGNRSVRITANFNESLDTSKLKKEVEELLLEFEDVELSQEYSFDLGGEDKEIADSFNQLFNSMFIGVILSLLILVIQFNSFRQTFMILLSIPFAVIGIFPGLALVGLPLSFPAFLGVVMLTGIVLNSAIVLVDQINLNRAKGMTFKYAISKACNLRIIPILLTSLTTILGLIPITITDELWRGLGASVIFGLTVSTLLVLFLIPILYSWLYAKSIENATQ